MTNKESLEYAYNLLVNYLNYDFFVYNMFHFGSRVYGTSDENSDYDFIAIINELPDNQSTINFKKENISIQLYTPSEFEFLKENHDIQFLEIKDLKKEFHYHDDNNFDTKNFNLDLWKLRKTISTISSNSWVKGKKKLIISADYDLRLAIKSIFHSLRILDYGVQIATTGKINCYSSKNWILDDLWSMSKIYSKNELWDKIDSKYRSVFNSLKSSLVEKCNKPEKLIELETSIDNLFKELNVKSDDNLILKQSILNFIKI